MMKLPSVIDYLNTVVNAALKKPLSSGFVVFIKSLY